MDAITDILDRLWDSISDLLPVEKPKDTVGRPLLFTLEEC